MNSRHHRRRFDAERIVNNRIDRIALHTSRFDLAATGYDCATVNMARA